MKSGVELNVNFTIAERVKLPLVPKTVTFTQFPGVGELVPAVMVRVDAAVPFGGKVTLVGLIDQVLQLGDGQRGEGDALRETVPEKPLRLVKMIVDVPAAPGLIVRLLGLAVTVNSGPGHAAADGTRNPRKP